jgi:hypothetical protein
MQVQQQMQPVRQSSTQKLGEGELRDLLEANLRALHAVFEDHQRTLAASLRKVTELAAEIRAIGTVEAPWVTALEQSRALLYVALREVIIGTDAAATQAMQRSRT